MSPKQARKWPCRKQPTGDKYSTSKYQPIRQKESPHEQELHIATYR